MSELKICPLMNRSGFCSETVQCYKEECMLWCKGENECSIKVLALEAIKRGEK
jgi:hypothetical protein